LVNGALLERYPGKTGYAIYFCLIAAMGIFGALAAWRLAAIVASKKIPAEAGIKER
jgi:hypothetical protein